MINKRNQVNNASMKPVVEQNGDFLWLRYVCSAKAGAKKLIKNFPPSNAKDMMIKQPA